MPLQIISRGESCATCSTDVRFLACMCSYMLAQPTAAGECLEADWTAVGSLAGMSSQMYLEFRFAFESLAAPSVRALKFSRRRLRFMNSHSMPLKLRQTSESFPTKPTGMGFLIHVS